MFSHIENYFEKHIFLRNVAYGLCGLVIVVGGQWALASWLVSKASPETPLAHTYCAIVASNADGTYNSELGNREFLLAKTLAYEHGGREAVNELRAKTIMLMKEYAKFSAKGDANDVRRHYQDKCLGF